MTALETLTLGRDNQLTPVATHALLTVLSDPPMLPTEIAKRTRVTAAAVTGIVDILERRGWVERLKSTRDRRSRPVSPTLRAFEVFQPSMEDEEVAS